MENFNIISYRLNRSVKPQEVLAAIEALTQKYAVKYQDCLFKASTTIMEYEFEGMLHSNKSENTVVEICKQYPYLNSFFKKNQKVKDDGHIDEELLICNFSDEDFSKTGEIAISTIREITAKIPRPYNPNDLEILFNGVAFSKLCETVTTITPSQSGFGLPDGNYIFYEHHVYGSEKHAYIHFSTDHTLSEQMRKLFFDFAKRIPGKCE